ncbi:sulfatase [Acidobacteria bacterium AH-259-O06]|nr:sulfatase [Acidobacteria bacterium AH-259-O06]
MLTGCQIAPSGESGWAEKHPNILFAISDDQSYPHASAYGFKAVRTPALDRVAESGVLFSNAFVASPGCSPSRAALLTGRHTWQLEHAGTHASSFPKEYVVYPDLLEKAGYFVGYTGKGWGPGNWEVSGRTRNPAGPEYNQHRLESAPSGISDKDYTANFQAFLEARPNDKPFGGHEPHRRFERGVGLSSDKKLEDVAVPPFLPDTPEIRSDILDYAVEIEWFDRHLGQMLKMLEERGELENTLVVVTSDNGMAFPRAKANLYEYGIHVPLAISWPAKVAGRRVVDDPVSLIDLAPTFLEAAGVEHPGTHPMVGRSLMNILISDKQGIVDPSRQGIFSARERHSSSRYDNLGYPCRVLRTRDYLYIRNFTPERRPAGAPQKYEENGKLGPMHGAYHDIDASPSLSLLLEKSNDPEVTRYFHLAVDKRPDEELYDIRKDPGCLNNLADSAEYAEIKERLRSDFEQYLTQTQDPRMGEQGDIFETYPRYSRIRRFPKPEENHQGN